jgi:hypothetical protein
MRKTCLQLFLEFLATENQADNLRSLFKSLHIYTTEVPNDQYWIIVIITKAVYKKLNSWKTEELEIAISSMSGYADYLTYIPEENQVNI